MNIEQFKLLQELMKAPLSLFTVEEFEFLSRLKDSSAPLGPADYKWLKRKVEEMKRNGTT